MTERYFCFGEGADQSAAHYLAHYYGETYLQTVLQDTSTSITHLETQLGKLQRAGCDDLILLPCRSDLEQVELLGEALDAIGIGQSGAEGRRAL